MIKLYSLAAGKKIKLLGQGSTLQEAIQDALDAGALEFYDDLGDYDLEKLEDYILGAKNDYVIEDIK